MPRRAAETGTRIADDEKKTRGVRRGYLVMRWMYQSCGQVDCIAGRCFGSWHRRIGVCES